MDWNILTAVIRLAILLPLILGLIYLVIKFGLGKMTYPFGQSYAMSIVDRLPIGPKSSLLVVRVAGKYYLLAQNDGSTNFLQELDSYPEMEMDNGHIKGFIEDGVFPRIKRKIKDFRSHKGEE